MMGYHFPCQCDVDYIGRSIQKLEDRIKQHVPWELLRRPYNTTSCSSQVQETAIGDKLAHHCIRRTNHSDDCFSVLLNHRSKQHINFLEAIELFSYITLPCAGREDNLRSFVYLGSLVGIPAVEFFLTTRITVI